MLVLEARTLWMFWCRDAGVTDVSSFESHDGVFASCDLFIFLTLLFSSGRNHPSPKPEPELWRVGF